MKFIKIFEDWYDEYSYSFADMGFTLKGLDGEKGSNKMLTGKYKGKYILTQMNSDFTEMIDRMSDDYNVVRTKNYFNSATGNANFEVEVYDNIDKENYIEIKTTDDILKWYPVSISFINYETSQELIRLINTPPLIRIKGRLESGSLKELVLLCLNYGKSNQKISFNLSGFSTKRPKIDKENILKLFKLIDDGHVEMDYIDKYEGIKSMILSQI